MRPYFKIADTQADAQMRVPFTLRAEATQSRKNKSIKEAISFADDTGVVPTIFFVFVCRDNAGIVRNDFFQRIILNIILLGLLCFTLPTMAQDTPYPTVDALNNMTLPPNDPIDLARRLRGITSAYVPPTSPPVWQIGDTQFFNVANSAVGQEQAINAELRGMSDNVLLWVQSNVTINDSMATRFVELVDSSIVAQVQELWGVVEPAGIDGDPRLYILMVTGLDNSIGGYFSDVHTYPRSVLPNSNQHEMMIINLSAFGTTDLLNPRVLTIIAHEYQHILRHFIDGNESTWLDEGFSTYTEHHIGWDSARSQAVSFFNQPDVQVNHWIADTHKFPRYGATFLLVNYFAEQYGLDALRQLSNEPLDGLAGLDAVLGEIDGETADEFFADWVLANYFRDPTTGYGYTTLDRNLPSARPIASIVNYPYQTSGRTPQYSTDYYTAFRLGDADNMTVSFSQSETVGMIPASVFDGEHMMYAVPADFSDVKLTRAIDLSSVDSATLTFRAWYDLEELWDYGYVMVSTDDGNRWQILPASTTRDRNPYNRAYGVGFTGQSFGWVEQTVSLDDYAGQEILLRFEVITDAASIRHGMAIDDVRIDAIGYSDSFEDNISAWIAEGWIHTDNRIPQRTWVQVAQVNGQNVTLSRWLTDTTEEAWTIPLNDEVDMVLVAVSPIAQQTMLEADYGLSISLE